MYFLNHKMPQYMQQNQEVCGTGLSKTVIVNIPKVSHSVNVEYFFEYCWVG